jgi:CheY-like chemotaxis protein
MARRAITLEAASANEALDLLTEFNPDVIVSDIGMPEKDGYRFMREARQRGVRVPAVALTAFARVEDRARCMQAGFQAHVSKPVEAGEFLTVVAGLIGRTPALAGRAGDTHN